MRQPRILPNLLARPIKRSAPPAVEIFRLSEDDLHPHQAWRSGWYCWSFEGPGEGSPAECDGLPSMYRGPFKSERSALQAAATLHPATRRNHRSQDDAPGASG